MIENYIIFILAIILALEVLFTILIDDDNEDVYNIFYVYDSDNSDNFNSLNYQTINDEKLDESHNIDDDEYTENNIDFPEIYKNEYIKNCYFLMKEFYSCLSKKNEIIDDCQILYEDKILEIQKCSLIYSNNSFEKVKMKYNNIFEKNENNDEDIMELLKDYEIDGYDEYTEKNIDDNSEIKEKEKENFIIVNNKDCVEYQLSKKDENYIICTKYE